MTADLNPDEFLAFCEQEKAGQVVLRAVATTKRNGIWRVEYEEVKKDVDINDEV